MESKKVSVPNISCHHCVHTIESELRDLAGVTDVKADKDNKTVEINWDSPATWEGIRDLLIEINYPAAE
jgi:copper chaperone